jgi:hypothetical protein
MGDMSTIFDNATRDYIHTKSRVLHGADKERFISEAEQELWDFMPFDTSEIRATVRRVLRRYLDDSE